MTQVPIEQSLAAALKLHQVRQFQQAEAIYRQILARDPNHARTLHLLGMLASQTGREEAAVELLGRTIALQPRLAEAHGNLGIAFKALGRLDQACASFQRALALKPDYPEARNSLGNVLRDMGRFDEAIASYQRAIVLKPDYPEAHNNLGNALREMGRLEEAVASFQRAIVLKPDLPDAHYNLGNVLRERGRFDEAIASYRRALALKPDAPEAENNLGVVLKDIGQLDEAVATYRRVLALHPNHPLIHSNLLYTLLYHADYDVPRLLEEHRLWARQFAEPLAAEVRPHNNDASPQRRLRVGYISPNFGVHAAGRHMLPLMVAHDHAQFEIHCFSDVVRPDAFTARFQNLADQWHNVGKLGDAALAQLIRDQKIDILMDWAMHMKDNRLLVFARKPAPVQVTFVAYPGTTGLRTIDYRLTDPYLDPPGQNDADYVEQSIRLPESFWCYDPAAMTMGLANPPDVGPLPARGAGHVTFGCLNNFCKINNGVLTLWARVLRAVPTSQLLLSVQPGVARQWVLERLAQEGVEPNRVQFAELLPREQYLRLYHRIDVGLDTLPYNGHTTSLDALWMGVPIVTLVGRTVVGRAGLSQCSNLGLTELVANTPEQYVQVAAELAGDLDRLEKLRSTLRARMLQSPLTDASRFARNIEAAYRQMWRQWCAAR